jgi:hypothetical protein
MSKMAETARAIKEQLDSFPPGKKVRIAMAMSESNAQRIMAFLDEMSVDCEFIPGDSETLDGVVRSFPTLIAANRESTHAPV